MIAITAPPKGPAWGRSSHLDIRRPPLQPTRAKSAAASQRLCRVRADPCQAVCATASSYAARCAVRVCRWRRRFVRVAGRGCQRSISDRLFADSGRPATCPKTCLRFISLSSAVLANSIPATAGRGQLQSDRHFDAGSDEDQVVRKQRRQASDDVRNSQQRPPRAPRLIRHDDHPLGHGHRVHDQDPRQMNAAYFQQRRAGQKKDGPAGRDDDGHDRAQQQRGHPADHQRLARGQTLTRTQRSEPQPEGGNASVTT